MRLDRKAKLDLQSRTIDGFSRKSAHLVDPPIHKLVKRYEPIIVLVQQLNCSRDLWWV